MEYVNNGDIPNGIKSMMSDMTKHQETCDHMGLSLGVMLLMGSQLETEKSATDWILGFN